MSALRMSAESAHPAALAAHLGAAAQRVAPAIARAAERVGEDFSALLHTARLESGFNPSARAPTSSATGLFQFIDATWLNTLARHGPKHGIAPATRAEALSLRRDPQVASLMAAEFMAENRRTLEGALGRAASATDLYLAHFLGAGGAVRFLSAMVADPGRAAAELFPRAATANRPIFFASGTPRSLAEVHALFARRLGLDSGTPVPSRPAEAGKDSPATPPAEPHDRPVERPLTASLSPALAARLAIAAMSSATISRHGGKDQPGSPTFDMPGLPGFGLPGFGLSTMRGLPEMAQPGDAAQAAYLLLAGLGR
jgi:hypothetical protein